MTILNKIKFPVDQYEKYILSSVKFFKLLMIIGETGSGKTTIVPKILHKERVFTKIIISQTKRIAAITAANYVSKLLNFKLGEEVGYAVRFENKTNFNTTVKFVTDGILFKEATEDPFLSQYTCVILDEFHERTVYTDLLLAILKKILIQRNSFRLIIMSASGECNKIAKFFNLKVGKIKIPGRLFSIKIFYTTNSQSNYVISISAFIIKCHLDENIPGNFLIFLPGQEELQKVSNQIEYIINKKLFNFIVLKFYSGMPNKEYSNVFKNSHTGIRKIILATNAAESSITIPGISVVIDSGLSKQKITNWKNGVDLFRIYPISKSEAKQRAGRAGRERTGKCFRMFTFNNFCKFSSYSRPEIQQIDLTSIILQLCLFKLKYFLSLDFIAVPPIWSVYRSVEKLFIFGIITSNFKVTYLGKLCTVFPLDISISITLIETLRGENEILLNMILATTSVLAINTPVFLKTNISFISHNYKKIKHLGDLFFYAIFFYQYQSIKKTELAKDWCKKKNLDENCLKLAILIKTQIKEICLTVAQLVLYPKRSTLIQTQFNLNDRFKLCFAAGYYLNTAIFSKQAKKYKGVCVGLMANIHSFSLYNSRYPKTIIFYEFFVTSKQYIRGITPIRLEWLIVFGKKIFV